MLMLVTAVAVHAQSLKGKQWCTVLNDEDGQGIAVALTFEKNGTCEILIATQHDMEEEGCPSPSWPELRFPAPTNAMATT